MHLVTVAREFIDYYTGPERHPSGGCGNCGGLPHSASCFVGRFIAALDEGATDPAIGKPVEPAQEIGSATQSSSSSSSPLPRSTEPEATPQSSLLHPVHQVYFRAGLIACREYMARFVEAQDPGIAASIRANWWPALGPDFGPPRQIDFSEITSGEYGTPEFRTKTAAEVSPTLEALPIALGFLGLVRASSPPPPVSPDSTTTRSRASERSDVGARQDLREVPDTKGSER